MGTPWSGDSPAWCSPALCTTPAPLPWPEVLVQPRPGARHPLLHTWPSLPHGTVRSSGAIAQHRHQWVQQSWRWAAQQGDGLSIQAYSGNLLNTRLSPTGCPLSLTHDPGPGSTAGPCGRPAWYPDGSAVLNAAEHWEEQGCRSKWWHSGTSGRCHSNASCVPRPAGTGEGCVGTLLGTGQALSPHPHAAPRGHGSSSIWSGLG